MSELSQFCNDVLDQFDGNITDAVFCYIQADKELMQRYLALVRNLEKGKQTVNSQLAQAITRKYDIKNTGLLKPTPNSVLIESYHELN